MDRLVALSLAGQLAMAPAAASAQIPSNEKPAAREDAVFRCMLEVRKSGPNASISAYITPRGDVKLSGGEREQAAFKQCLTQRGFDMHRAGPSPAPPK